MKKIAIALIALGLMSTPSQAQHIRYERDHYVSRDQYDRAQARHRYEREMRRNEERRRYQQRHYRYQRYGHERYGYERPYGTRYYRGSTVVYDYHRYGLREPRPGHRYYRERDGSIVEAAIIGGLIAAIIVSLD